MNPSRMLELRNRVEKALHEHLGADMDGGGTSLVNPPSTDLDATIDGKRYNIRIKALEELYDFAKE